MLQHSLKSKKKTVDQDIYLFLSSVLGSIFWIEHFVVHVYKKSNTQS